MNYSIGFSGNQTLIADHPLYSQYELLDDTHYRLIECNIEEKSMKVKEKDGNNEDWIEIDIKDLQPHAVLDINNNGERWEGDTLYNKPFGYGFYYSAENSPVYAGFVFNDKYVCYGSCYYPNSKLIEYIGCFYNGMKHGKGKLYDKKGNTIYDGDWSLDNPISSECHITPSNQDTLIHYGLEEIEIDSNCCNSIESFIIRDYSKLTKLTIGDKSCCKVKYFEINNCSVLEEITIGNNSFNNHIEYKVDTEFKDFSRSFHIKNCSSLEEITIGNQSFIDYAGGFELSGSIH